MASVKILVALLSAVLLVAAQDSKIYTDESRDWCNRITAVVQTVFSIDCGYCTASKVKCTAENVRICKPIYNECDNVTDLCEKVYCIRNVTFRITKDNGLTVSCFGPGSPCGPYDV
ncbi:Uncharacterised protein g3413 [Pycnogonum litorale]